MDLKFIHFTHPLILWALVGIPLMWILATRYYQQQIAKTSLDRQIDAHLLPYLLKKKTAKEKSLFKVLTFWSLAAICLIVALSGPRWNLREVEISTRDQSLVMILDLSESMNVSDSKPTRLIRAKQKIQDIMQLADENKESRLKLGLIAFAADPHMIAPLTEDKEMIRQILPSITTELVYVQGSRLTSALDLAASLLEGEPSNTKAILILSDGGYEDSSALSKAKKLADQGIVIHTMGFGTTEGAPVKDAKGNILKKKGQTVLSKLDKSRLAEVSKMGQGRYLDSNSSDQELSQLLHELESSEIKSQKHEMWDEGFYLMVIPVLPIMLWWFRRGAFFAIFLVGCHTSLQAFPLEDAFRNSEEKGACAFELGDYESACEHFDDPYKKGVAYYKCGKFKEAEKCFASSQRPEVGFSSLYNLGNCYAKQQKFKEAIKAYEDVLTEQPNHTRAKENLAIVKQLKDDQQKQNSPDKSNSDKDKENQDEKKDSSDSDKEDKDKDQEKKNPPKDEQEEEEKDEKENPENNDDSSHEDEKDQKEDQQKDQPEATEPPPSQEENKSPPPVAQSDEQKSEEEHNADLWLNKLENDPKDFLKNKFYIESVKNKTKGGVDPW